MSEEVIPFESEEEAKDPNDVEVPLSNSKVQESKLDTFELLRERTDVIRSLVRRVYPLKSSYTFYEHLKYKDLFWNEIEEQICVGYNAHVKCKKSRGEEPFNFMQFQNIHMQLLYQLESDEVRARVREEVKRDLAAEEIRHEIGETYDAFMKRVDHAQHLDWRKTVGDLRSLLYEFLTVIEEETGYVGVASIAGEDSNFKGHLHYHYIETAAAVESGNLFSTSHKRWNEEVRLPFEAWVTERLKNKRLLMAPATSDFSDATPPRLLTSLTSSAFSATTSQSTVHRAHSYYDSTLGESGHLDINETFDVSELENHGDLSYSMTDLVGGAQNIPIQRSSDGDSIAEKGQSSVKQNAIAPGEVVEKASISKIPSILSNSERKGKAPVKRENPLHGSVVKRCSISPPDTPSKRMKILNAEPSDHSQKSTKPNALPPFPQTDGFHSMRRHEHQKTSSTSCAPLVFHSETLTPNGPKISSPLSLLSVDFEKISSASCSSKTTAAVMTTASSYTTNSVRENENTGCIVIEPTVSVETLPLVPSTSFIVSPLHVMDDHTEGVLIAETSTSVGPKPTIRDTIANTRKTAKSKGNEFLLELLRRYDAEDELRGTTELSSIDTKATDVHTPEGSVNSDEMNADNCNIASSLLPEELRTEVNVASQASSDSRSECMDQVIQHPAHFDAVLSFLRRVLDDEFSSSVHKLLFFEYLLGFQDRGGKIITTMRPAVLGTWCNRYRSFKKLPKIKNLHEYADGMEGWWVLGQHEFRLLKGTNQAGMSSNRLDVKAIPNAEENWDDLAIGGRFGFQMFLLGMAFWRFDKRFKESQSLQSRFVFLMHDIDHVLDFLIDYLKKKKLEDGSYPG